MLGHDSPIAIGAHIKDLGRPHNGPDTEENVLCLCPNHHALFDRYGFYIDPDTLEIKDLNEDLINNKMKKLTVKAKHKIEKDYKIKVSMITYGSSTVYSLYGEDSKKRLKLNL